MKIWIWMLVVALTMPSSSVFARSDSAIYGEVQETRVRKQARPNVDKDVRKLTRMESRYRERLPLRNNKFSRKSAKTRKYQKTKPRPRYSKNRRTKRRS